MQRKLDLNSNFDLKFTLNDKYLTFWNVVKRELQRLVQYLISQLRQKEVVETVSVIKHQLVSASEKISVLLSVMMVNFEFMVLEFTWSNLSDHHAVQSRSPPPMFSYRWIIRLRNKTLRNGVFILAPEQDYQPHTEMVDKL